MYPPLEAAYISVGVGSPSSRALIAATSARSMSARVTARGGVFGRRSSRAQKPPASSNGAWTIGSLPPLPQAASTSGPERRSASFPECSPVLLEVVAVESRTIGKSRFWMLRNAPPLFASEVRLPSIVCRVSNGVVQRSGMVSVTPLAKLPSPNSSEVTSVLVA